MNNLAGIAAVFAAMLAGLCSCVQIEDKGQETGVAYISFSSLTVDYDVEGLAFTKANVPAEDLPGAEDFTVRISGEGMDDLVFAPGDVPSEPLVVRPGIYTVEASYGSNGFDGPYFCKSVSVEVASAQTGDVALEDIPLANAMVALMLPEGLSQHLDLNSMQLTDGNVVKAVEPGQYVYVPAGVAISARFSGVNSLGESKQISYPMGILEGQHAYAVTCDLSLPAVNITLPDQQPGAWATRLYVTPASVVSELPAENLVYEVVEAGSSDWSAAVSSEVISGNYHVIKGLDNGKSYKVRARLGGFVSNEQQVTVKDHLDAATFSAAHTYESDYLTGSVATVDLGIKAGILKTLYDAGWLVVRGGTLKYGSTDVRSISSLSGTMSVTEGWPYLPQGNGYSFEVYHRLQGESSEIISKISGINVPAPQFTVSASAYTSYDKYLSSDLTFANNHDNKYIVFDRKAGVTISNELLANANYSKSSSITFNGSQVGTFDSNSKSYGNAAGCSSWQNYPLVASMTFDGVTNSATKDCHITGLPYTAAPPKNDGDHPWSKTSTGLHTVDWKDDYVYLEGSSSKQTIASPSFYIPDDINVTVTVPVKLYSYAALWIWAQPELVCRVGGNQVFSKVGDKGSTNWGGSGNKTQEYTGTGSGTLTTSNKTVEVENAYTMSSAYICVYSVELKYR